MPIHDRRRIRGAAAAGMFYDGDALSLRRRIAECEHAAGAVEPFYPRPVGAVLPHAGYLYSLDTAVRTLLAAGARRIARPRRVVILAPSHYVAFAGAALASFDVWATPFGEIGVDREALGKLLDAADGAAAIRDDAQQQEHAIEVELPLIQYFFPGAEILPVTVGHLDRTLVHRIGSALARTLDPGDLVIVSSDFTHYGTRFGYTPFGVPALPERLAALDRSAGELAAARDAAGFAAFLRETRATICGADPLLAYLEMLAVSKSRCSGRIAAQSDSGRNSGDYRHVVGYVGIVYGETDGAEQ